MDNGLPGPLLAAPRAGRSLRASGPAGVQVGPGLSVHGGYP